MCSKTLFASSFCRRRFFRSTTFAGRSWCPEVGLRFLDSTFCDRSEVESRIPKPTSGHLDRVTCRCPEVGLGIPNSTSGHQKFLVSRSQFRNSSFKFWIPLDTCAAEISFSLRLRRRKCFWRGLSSSCISIIIFFFPSSPSSLSSSPHRHYHHSPSSSS